MARCLCLLLWERCADGSWLVGNVTLSYAESTRVEDFFGGVVVVVVVALELLFYKERKRKKKNEVCFFK